MNSVESETLIEVEKIKAKAEIAVAVINTLNSAASSYNGSSIDNLISVIKKIQATLD